MENEKSIQLSERIENLLYHAMKALDEQRGKTLLYNRFRDCNTLAWEIDDALKEIKKLKKTNELEGRPNISLLNFEK